MEQKRSRGDFYKGSSCWSTDADEHAIVWNAAGAQSFDVHDKEGWRFKNNWLWYSHTFYLLFEPTLPLSYPPYFDGNYRVTQLNESRNIQLERETSWFPRSFTTTAYSLFPIKKCFFPLLLFFSVDQIGWRSAQHGHQCNQSHGTHSDTLSH